MKIKRRGTRGRGKRASNERAPDVLDGEGKPAIIERGQERAQGVAQETKNMKWARG